MSGIIFGRENHISESKDNLLVKFPQKLCIYSPDHRDVCLWLFNELQKNASKKSIILDFSKMVEITASGAVALFARVTSLQILTGNDALFTIIQPKEQRARKLFKQSGLYDALRPGGKRKLDKLWDSNIKFRSGFNQEKHLDPTLELIGSLTKTPHRLKEAINEAILNIHQHAYADAASARGASLIKRWWQYCYLDRDNNRFVFVISDLGRTIPSSFGVTSGTHANAIAYAMQKGVSSTGHPWRGKGSQDIKEPIHPKTEDKLIVVSGLGLYVYNSNNEVLTDLNIPYMGTLIAWSFDLGGENDDY